MPTQWQWFIGTLNLFACNRHYVRSWVSPPLWNRADTKNHSYHCAHSGRYAKKPLSRHIGAGKGLGICSRICRGGVADATAGQAGWLRIRQWGRSCQWEIREGSFQATLDWIGSNISRRIRVLMPPEVQHLPQMPRRRKRCWAGSPKVNYKELVRINGGCRYGSAGA